MGASKKTPVVVCIPGRREDGKDARWYDAANNKRVRSPLRKRRRR